MTPSTIPSAALLRALEGMPLSHQHLLALASVAESTPDKDLVVLAQLLAGMAARIRLGSALLEEMRHMAPSPSWDNHVTDAIVQAQGWAPLRTHHPETQEQ